MYMVLSPGTDVEEDRGNVGLATSNNGQEYPLHVEILGVRVGELQSSDMRRTKVISRHHDNSNVTVVC